jgi:hypothetical protein
MDLTLIIFTGLLFPKNSVLASIINRVFHLDRLMIEQYVSGSIQLNNYLLKPMIFRLATSNDYNRFTLEFWLAV